MATLLLALMNTAEFIAEAEYGHTLTAWRHLSHSKATAECTTCRRAIIVDGMQEEQHGMTGSALAETCTSLTV